MAHKKGGRFFVKETDTYLLVDSKVLPEVFVKVVEAKKLIKAGRCKTTSEAVEKLKLSRSAFYKYKNSVFLVEEMSKDRIITLFFEVFDQMGVLSCILKVLAAAKTSVLTINQSIPVDGNATIVISLKIEGMSISVENLLKKLRGIEFVRKAEITSGE